MRLYDKSEEYSLSKKPPASITGVGGTACGHSVSPDWFSLTFSDSTKFALIEKELQRQYPDQTGTSLPFGGKGYRRSIKFGSARLLYDGAAEMGFHVELTGEAIRQALDFFDFLCFAYESGASCSRFDLAYDDKTGEHINVHRIVDTVDAGGQLGKFKKSKLHKEQKNNGEITNHGMSFGSRSSDVYARAYNKLLERKGKLSDDVIMPKVWNRLEFELKGKHADSAFKQYIEKGKESIRSIFRFYARNYLSFRIENPTDINRSRWPVASWWSTFLSLLPTTEIIINKVTATIHKKAKWFAYAVKKSFAILLKSPLYGADWLHEQVEQGIRSMTEQDKAMSAGTPF